MKRINVIIIVMAMSLWFCGCVERIISIKSTPPGAVVWLNGQEAGTTPMNTSFTWYGQYDVTLRKQGYQTLKTSKKIDPPLYQWPIIDLVAECLLPITFVDSHEWEFQLSQQSPPEVDVLIERAQSLKSQVDVEVGK